MEVHPLKRVGRNLYRQRGKKVKEIFQGVKGHRGLWMPENPKGTIQEPKVGEFGKMGEGQEGGEARGQRRTWEPQASLTDETQAGLAGRPWGKAGNAFNLEGPVQDGLGAQARLRRALSSQTAGDVRCWGPRLLHNSRITGHGLTDLGKWL